MGNKHNLFASATRAALAVMALTAAASSAMASGFEKTILWSGRYSGIAGITAPNVVGAEALASNPAGILQAKPGQELNANLSLLQSQFKGPIGANDVQETGSTTMVFPFGLMYAASLNDNLAFAVGGFTVGGAKSEYDDIAFPIAAGTNNALKATVKSDLSVNEFSAGVAYKPIEHLRLGAAWRVSFVQADFASFSLPANNNTQVANLEFSNIRDTQWFGYRLGAQWTDDNWGAGLSYRSEVLFSGSADVKGNVGAGASTILPTTSNGATVGSVLPAQVTFGGYYDFQPKVWRGYLEYDFTNYSRVDAININGSFTPQGGSSTNIPSLRLNWLDQHNVRIAGEYLGAVVPIRFGYAWTSQVTSSDYACATFVPPAAAHTVALGTGMDFMDGTLRTDAGLDYTFSSASASANPSDSAVRSGDYAVTAIGLHLGASYMF